jgi:hypothetical protein
MVEAVIAIRRRGGAPWLGSGPVEALKSSTAGSSGAAKGPWLLPLTEHQESLKLDGMVQPHLFQSPPAASGSSSKQEDQEEVHRQHK